MTKSSIADGIVIGVAAAAALSVASFLYLQSSNAEDKIQKLMTELSDTKTKVTNLDNLLSSFAKIEDGRVKISADNFYYSDNTITISKEEYLRLKSLESKN